jgi:hypothetical protein
LWNSRSTKEQHITDVVFCLYTAFGGGLSVPVQGLARMEAGGESVTETHLGGSIAGLGLSFDRGDFSYPPVPVGQLPFSFDRIRPNHSLPRQHFRLQACQGLKAARRNLVFAAPRHLHVAREETRP